ncbi:MAG: UDP-glucose 4-epimerase GalE [Cytophagaceae bacterium]
MNTNKKILVTGGAGYIGSHTVRMLAEKGYKVLVVDNMIYGHQDAIVNPDVELVIADISNQAAMNELFSKNEIEAVMHFAAFAYVGESVNDPAKYYFNNLVAPINLIEVMRKHGCDKFIFSSTCATYGNPERIPIDECHRQDPINPYGQSKLMLEKILKDYNHAYGFKYVFLRYFNASGASEDALIGEDHSPETHLIPLVLEAAKGLRPSITVFGTDYETPDGTCIRDYIHVNDLASAHILALQHLQQGKDPVICNLGTGRGYSVKEVIELSEKVTGLKVPVVYGERRPGDPPQLVADPTFAKETLGWEAQYKNLEDIIRTAWKWHNGPREGRYKKKSVLN